MSPLEIFKNISAVNIPERTVPFVICEEDLVSMGIVFAEKIFYERFLGKTEGPSPDHVLYFGDLLYPAEDKSILLSLGGRERGGVQLSDIFFLTKSQECEKKGFLLNGGLANLFYTSDREGLPFVGGFCSTPNGWSLHVDKDNSVKWREGRRIFSRNISPMFVH
ncbi:MAG: hypothetical protein WC870_00545 [Candidatus Paceibacterota bacterium]